ncbi:MULTISPECIES: YdcF family protein [Niastella]|uniref:YdcF family protein n=1 Tax=Niastella soli TaxID=2821487 RepID=A0ABS3YPI1_9BACT|nr:YdcF family protein [Niastella soli]MBO9199375.1 YdcF family protein [Niastella soli]
MKYLAVTLFCFCLILCINTIHGQNNPNQDAASINEQLLKQGTTDAQSFSREKGMVFYNSGQDEPEFSNQEMQLLLNDFSLLGMLGSSLNNLQYEPRLFRETKARLKQDAKESVKGCRTAACYSNSLKFTSFEIMAIGDELVNLTTKHPQFKSMVQGLKKIGKYHLFNNEADSGFIRKAWEADALGINYILQTYIEGNEPLYPKIDAISFVKDDPVFADSVKAIVTKISSFKYRTLLFYRIPVKLAIEILRLNGRDEAMRYNGLMGRSYNTIVQSVRNINWDLFPNSVILVPGLGPERPDISLDSGSARRCDSAAVRYYTRRAPFIVVSGGHVHPNKTPYCEAIEMKKYLINKWHIPEPAIIIEPNARHTTTNLRNTNRLLYKYNFPTQKPVLIVSDPAQTAYINGAMKDKAIKELGYAPFSTIRKISPTETEYLPSQDSRHINSMDPLDP